MAFEIRAPSFPESISEGTIAAWKAEVGTIVSRDTVLVEVETDKVMIEVVAPESGRLTEIVKEEGDVVASEELLGQFAAATEQPRAVAVAVAQSTVRAPAPMPTLRPTLTPTHASTPAAAGPAARKLAAEQGVQVDAVRGTGRGGRVTKADIMRESDTSAGQADGAAPPDDAADTPSPLLAELAALSPDDGSSTERSERRVPMTRLRASIARRLVDAQRTAAMLTTFNEVDMTAIIALREKYREQFATQHAGVRLGFMGFFVRAAVEALKRFPAVNASIDGTDIVYHSYYDIGVAVGTERGLVVPVLRDADALTMAQIETTIRDFGAKAKDNKLSLQDMSGGTFTISNGGVYGSLLSTPILNPPQTAILGMHKIQDRAIVEQGAVVVRPMMYLALSYDHRLIDGSDAVRFLIAIKDGIEDPVRMLLDI